MNRIECPKPGVYRDVPAATYFAWDAVNNSSLKHFIRSPAHYIASLVEEDEEAIEKNRGTICHGGLWEPARFAAEYAIGPDVDLRTKAGKEEWSSFADANPSKTLVRAKDGVAMEGVRRSVWSHPFASKLLSSEGPCEVCLVWRDEITGLMCKARLDKVSLDYSYIADLKTTGDARPDAFREQAHKLGYWRQSSWYLDACAKNGLSVDGFCIIAAEVEPPYALSVFVMEQEEIEIASLEVADALQGLAECKRTGIFPGYDPKPQPLMRPERVKARERWAAKEMAGAM